MKHDPDPEALLSRVQQRFRRGLSTYHEEARAQAQIARILAEMIQASSTETAFDAVLEFGCGTGHLTDALLRRFAISNITLNDLVPESALPACAVAEGMGVLPRFLGGPVEALALHGEYDLIASASTVQWIADLPPVLERLCSALRPGGWLALSGFGTAQFHELAALGPVAAAPNYMDAHDWSAALPQGMDLVAVRQRPIVLEFPSALDVLRHLRATGVNGEACQSWTKSQLLDYQQAYMAEFSRNGILPLTYDPVMLVARRNP